MSKQKIIFAILFILASAIIVLECLNKDATFSYKTNFSKIAALYEPIKENKDIHVIVSYPIALSGGFPRGYQLLGQMVHQKTMLNGLDPFSASSAEIHARVSDISNPKTIDELTRLGVDAIVIYDQLLDHSSEVIGQLLSDDRLEYIGYYAVEPDANAYASLNDLSKSIAVFQIKKALSGETDRSEVASDANETTFAKQNGYAINVSLSGVKTGDHLYFAQTYSPDWKVYAGKINDPTGLSFLWRPSIFDQTHEINGESGNRWTVEVDELKAMLADEATESPDAIVNAELTIFFRPRALFFLEWGVALGTIAFCLGYVGWDMAKKRKQKTRA